MEKTLRQRIAQIKDIAEAEKLSIADIADIVSETGEYVSEPTIRKMLSDSSESMGFQYHSVISIYEALINRFGDMPDIKDVEKLRLLIAERDKQIDRIVMQSEKRETELEHRDEIYADRKSVYEAAIDLLKKQIEFKDEEIRKKDELIEKLINKIMT